MNYVSPYICQDGYCPKNTKKQKIGVDSKHVKKWEHLHTVSGNAKQNSCYGKQFVVAQN